jgi:hypothetical protein
MVYRENNRLTQTDLSLEFLMGRALDNAMLNVDQKDVATSKLLRNTQPLAFLIYLQRVLPTSAFVSRMSSPRSTMPLLVTAVWDVLLLASSTLWLR